MTKKSLADLLREEAHKSPDSEAEAVQEAALEPLEPAPTLSETEPTTTSYETTDDPSPLDTAAPRAKRLPTKAELEITVSELREALKDSHGKENSLQQQIADLQSDLQEQKILLQKLLGELEQTSQIKAELEQAKKVILQLVADSSKTTQEANTRSKATQEPNTPKKENKDLRPQKLALKKLPQHSVQPDSPSGEIFERNVGWFD